MNSELSKTSTRTKGRTATRLVVRESLRAGRSGVCAEVAFLYAVIVRLLTERELVRCAVQHGYVRMTPQAIYQPGFQRQLRSNGG
jgi:hypothetical protein